MQKKICLYCKQEYEPKRNRANQKFCCYEHSQLYRAKNVNQYISKGDYTEMVVQSKKFGKQVVKINNSDVEKCKKCIWVISQCSKDLYVYTAKTKYHPRMSLHRYLTDCPKNLTVDHINRDTLDNRLSNLRICTQTIQNINRVIGSKNKSGYKNISYCSNHRYWRITFTRYGKQKQIGTTKTLEEAIKIRDEYLKECGELGIKNYDGRSEEDKRKESEDNNAK